MTADWLDVSASHKNGFYWSSSGNIEFFLQPLQVPRELQWIRLKTFLCDLDKILGLKGIHLAQSK